MGTHDKAERRLIEMLGCKVDELPTLPEVAYQTFQMTNDEDHTSRELAALISRDPSFASRLLTVANSAGYGMSAKVNTIQRAIVVLGVDCVRDLALGLAAFAAAGSKRPIRRRVHRTRLWNHSKMVGLACETLARYELGLGGGYYVLGLLHDIGKVALDAFRSRELDRILDMVDRQRLPWTVAEREVLGFDHSQVGEAMLTYWHYPEDLIAAVSGHHNPWNWNGGGLKEAGLVFLADRLAHITENTASNAASCENGGFLSSLGWSFDHLMAERVLDNMRSMGQSLGGMEI